jgi:predicted DNA-binding transcriptional regulator YafY
MRIKTHDKIAMRLAQILRKLNNGEKLSVEALAQEFSVTTRTIQRDLNERFFGIPLKKEHKFYVVDTQYLGNLNFSDIRLLAKLASKPSYSYQS